ncbi:ornithine decarboxylase [Malassezia cuniculi]|uniref:ornithine decarboxylase n=1 Tax=Malassezia cuniculi TaxID=948313 RepID=A0AAF0EY08_9BASI|nr:ornithine decarboxylase [Malassezia cuniculi]
MLAPYPRALTPPPEPEAASIPVGKLASGEHVYSGSFAQQFEAALGDIDVDTCEAEGENAFFVADLAQIYRQHMWWLQELPRIVPFYAVKCNPEPAVIRLLAALGTGFDCASNGEIQQVLGLGISPSRIIYANPCKAASFVRRALKQGIDLTTFDNLDELDKIKRFHPDCKLVVRILTDDSKSVCQLGIKFGAPLCDVPALLARARALELDVVGVSFHVGSGCYDPAAYRDALMRARAAFDMGEAAGYNFDLLDIGGGFENGNFGAIAQVVRDSLDEYFPDVDFAPGGRRVQRHRDGLRIIAEPGRFYVHNAFSLATNIIARRQGHVTDGNGPQAMYYQNDGAYGAFNCLIFDHQVVRPKVLTLDQQFVYRPDAPGAGEPDGEEMHSCSVWGPTCDSMDCILRETTLPRALDVGDWLVYENMGAYTLCAASSFNGLRPPRVRYTLGSDIDGAQAVYAVLSSAGHLCN